ncbi:MAG TPA: exonuclease subunit SbcD [Bryobacteraceae bacterium]|jgi:exonuclease SbcD
MRFLHTGDWHVGKTLRGRSRLDEQQQVITEILDVAVRERVDCLLMAGDVFDSVAPPADAERLVFDCFAEIVKRGLDAVVIGGNHDHPKKLAALRALLDPLRIRVRPEPESAAAGGVVEVIRGGEAARIAVLPWVAERKLVGITELMGPEEDWRRIYSEDVASMASVLARGFTRDTVNILMAHVFAGGAKTGASERSLHVTIPFALDAARFPAAAQYIALGHIHKPQRVMASPARCEYSGSTLQLDFGEHGQTKRVVLVDCKAGGVAHVENIPLTAGRQLTEVAGTLGELRSGALFWMNDFLRVTLEVKTASPGLANEVRRLFPNAVEIRIRALETEPPLPPDAGVVIAPADHFGQFYQAIEKAKPHEELMGAFERLYDEVNHASDAAGA